MRGTIVWLAGVWLAGLLMLAAQPRLAVAAAPPGAEPDPIAAVVAKVSSAVVRVTVVRPPKPPEDAKPDPKTTAASTSGQMTRALGSGFVIDPAGFIATNKHVVDNATAIFVVTAQGVRYPATIVGMPDKADMALLRIDAGHPLPSVVFGDSDKMRVGDTVIAIGSPFGFDNTVTAGVISAVNRNIMESPFDDYFQTDAAINHGNSGGPLFNLAGEVVGMNSVIFAPGTGSVGVGFALPSNDLHFVFDRLMKTGEIKAGMLPIHTQQVSWMLQQALGAPNLEGAVVSSVQDADDAMLHGNVKPGDVILSFNGQHISDPRDLARKAARTPVGSEATLEIDRGGQRSIEHVTIQGWPEAKLPVIRDTAPTLGLDLVATPRENGAQRVIVESVDQNGSAADSGIQKGDIILEVQRNPVSAVDQALRIFKVESFAKHAYAAVLVERGKNRVWIPMALPPE